MKLYIMSVLYALSHLLNAVLGGSHTHSFSARVGHASFKGKAKWARVVELLIDSIFGEYHCYAAYDEVADTFKD